MIYFGYAFWILITAVFAIYLKSDMSKSIMFASCALGVAAMGLHIWERNFSDPRE